MTRWDAVAVGVVAAVLVEALNALLWGRLTLVGGLAGSAIAGYLGGDELPDGALHGLLAALAWGIVLIPTSVLVALGNDGLPLFPAELLASVVATPGELTAVILLGVTLPNLLTGALGSATRWHLQTRRR